MTSFRLLVVAFFIVTVFHTFLTEDARISLLLLFVSVIVLAQSKWLLTQYMKSRRSFWQICADIIRKRGKKREKPQTEQESESAFVFKRIVTFVNALDTGFVHALRNVIDDKTSLPPRDDETVVFQPFEILRNLELFAADAVDDFGNVLGAVKGQKLQNAHLS